MATHTEAPVRERRERKAVVGTSLTPKVIELLDTIAFDRHITTASLIREAVHYYLEGKGYDIHSVKV